MSEDYEVGYGKPPKAHQFKPGNQAARKKKTISVSEAIEKALNTKRKIRKGDKELTLSVGEIVVERLVQLAMGGNARDLVKFVEIAHKYAPDALAGSAEELTITYTRAENSKVELPPADLWEKDK